MGMMLYVSYTAADCDVHVGMTAVTGRNGMRAYPKPFTDRCTVGFDTDHPEAIDLELRDRLGRVVWRDKRGFQYLTNPTNGF
jgi:hypothetical protein